MERVARTFLIACLLLVSMAVPVAAATSKAASTTTALAAWDLAHDVARRYDGEILVRAHAQDPAGKGMGDGSTLRWVFTFLTPRDRGELQDIVQVTVDASGRATVVRDASRERTTAPGLGEPGIDSDEATRLLKSAAGWKAASKGATAAHYDLVGWGKTGPVWVVSFVKADGSRSWLGVQAHSGRMVTAETAEHAWRGYVLAEAARQSTTLIGDDSWTTSFSFAYSAHTDLVVHVEFQSLAQRVATERGTVVLTSPDGREFRLREPEVAPNGPDGWLATFALPVIPGTWTVEASMVAPSYQEIELRWCGSGTVSPLPHVALQQRANAACAGILDGA